jgi:threonine/homoserine/homoserine lactone efflux protein
VSIDTVLAFAALSVVLIAVPGPAVVLVLKSAVLRGRGSAFLTALGVLSADLIWATASMLGLTALLVSSQLAFDAVRIVGAAYLIYLGTRLLRTRRFDLASAESDAGQVVAVTPRRAFAEGFVNDLSNPKTVLIYASIIPQFLTASSSGSDAFVLGVVFALLGFAALSAYAMVFGAARTLLSKGRVMRTVLRGSGGILVLFGGALLVERPTH